MAGMENSVASIVPSSSAGKISPPAINCVETPSFSITFAPNPKNLILSPFRSSTLLISFRCVLEIDGSYKIGNYIPGTKIPILNENILSKKKPHYLILFSWHIKNELKKNLKRKGFKGKFIIPLPTPKIES